MPELPEVEHLRRTLNPLLVGGTVESVKLAREDVLRFDIHANGSRRVTGSARLRRAALLHKARVARLERQGKQLAMIADDGRTLCIHLGMSGHLRFLARGNRLRQCDHVHCVWRIDNGGSSGRLIFRDPRRFGGLWAFPTMRHLHELRWNRLGPDALSIDSTTLHERLAHTRRAIKAAMLDQSCIAGIGNIYADEALFRARIHPLTAAHQLTHTEVTKLACAICKVLRQAIEAGGSTLRDYADGNGEAGRYARRHAVYARDGLPCRRCSTTLVRILAAQRSTVYCPLCQEK